MPYLPGKGVATSLWSRRHGLLSLLEAVYTSVPVEKDDSGNYNSAFCQGPSRRLMPSSASMCLPRFRTSHALQWHRLHDTHYASTWKLP